MSERKPCIRCERTIDAMAGHCPFCNWDQSRPAPPPEAVPQQKMAVQYVPEDDIREQIKRKGMFAGAGVLVLVASFLIGMVINSDDAAPEDAPPPVAEQAQQNEKVAAPTRRASTPLVPTNERGGIEQPITSAPVAGAAADPNAPSNSYDRSDATAVSSVEYNDLAKRAKAEKERMSALVDPRSLTGAAYAQGQRPVARRPLVPAQQQPQQTTGLPGTTPPPPLNRAPEASAPQQEAPRVADAPKARRGALRTRPVPVSQPLPRLYATGTARLTLIIGPDGRVKNINIERALSRNTSDLIEAVQRWRFKPATEDGEPISAPYSVDISFGGR